MLFIALTGAHVLSRLTKKSVWPRDVLVPFMYLVLLCQKNARYVRKVTRLPNWQINYKFNFVVFVPFICKHELDTDSDSADRHLGHDSCQLACHQRWLLRRSCAETFSGARS